MSQSGPIIVVEDDDDDQFLVKQSLSELGVKNQCLFFSNGQQAYRYLLDSKEQPFLILCDINMPVMNGLELRERIESDQCSKRKQSLLFF